MFNGFNRFFPGFFGIVLGLLGASVQATTYYVSTTGSDVNPGTQASPFATIQKAADIVQPGDVVKVLAGTYYERIEMKTSGTAQAPIVFEGEQGANGEWKTIVDGASKAPVTGWTLATEKGWGIYKRQCGLNQWGMFDKPFAMTMGDKYIYHIHDYAMLPGEISWTVLAYGADADFWDACGAAFGTDDAGMTYLRFRNGENPDVMNVRSCPEASAFLIPAGINCNVLRGFHIQGAFLGADIQGSQNTIENCRIINGDQKVRVSGSFNAVRNNTMYWNGLFPVKPGAWHNAGEIGNALGLIRVMFYGMEKTTFRTGSTPTVHLQVSGNNHEIAGNHIYEADVLVLLNNAENVRVHGNRIHNGNYGIIFGTATFKKIEVFENLINDNNINVRFLNLEINDHEIYFYRNRFVQPKSLGSDHIHFHWQGPEYNVTFANVKIHFYHNSFSGGELGLYTADGNFPSTSFINNIFSAKIPLLTSNSDNSGNEVGLFAYNWVGPSSAGSLLDYNIRAYGPENIYASQMTMWPQDSLPMAYSPADTMPFYDVPDFILPSLPAAVDAHQRGLDLSKSFLDRGVTWGPYPGMEAGYFTGAAPDIGAIESHPGTPGIKGTVRGTGNNAGFNFSFGQGNGLNQAITISYSVPKLGLVRISVHNLLGQEISRPLNAETPAGMHAVNWDGKDAAGKSLADGVYAIRMQANGQAVAKKMVMIR